MNLLSKLALTCIIISFVVFYGSYKVLAAPQTLPFDFPVPALGDLVWEGIEESECFESGVSQLVLQDATDAQGNGDAYDAAWATSVNDTLVIPVGTGDLTGNTYTSVPQNISGLDVVYKLYFSEDTQCNRFILLFQNVTSSTVNATVRIGTDFGSDGDTEIDGTSSGDLSFTTADRWLVTSDGGPDDPVNTTVFYGPGSPEVIPSSVDQAACYYSETTQGAAADFDITVPPRDTRCLMLFGCLADITGLDNTIEGALAAAPLFNSNDTIPGDLLNGLSADDLSRCVNWDFGVPPPPPTPAIPTLSEWGMISAAAGLGLIGLFFAVRRKRAMA